jgi:hypothetical protein
MKTVVTWMLAFGLCYYLQAQDADTVRYWKKGGQAALNFSQVSLTNWIQGGENSLAVNGFFNIFADYSRGKSIWTNHKDGHTGPRTQFKEVFGVGLTYMFP